jgi:cell division protein FtsW (lipid II flippase)
MTNESTTVILGIPIPSTDPLFLAIVGVHVLFGLAAVTTGAIAMLSSKGRGRHSNWGTTYFWFLFGVFATMSALSFMRWAENYHLFILGVLSFASALFGRTAVQRRWYQWPRLHLTGMGVSYIFLLTAFYVDNGKNLPLWREFPQIAFWFLPSAVGVPVILYALMRHPLVLALGRSQPPQIEAGT